MKKIKDLEELKKIASNGYIEVCILLAGGAARSSKDIEYMEDTDTWNVFNYIDSSEDVNLTTQELGEYTNIIKALDNGVLYKDE